MAVAIGIMRTELDATGLRRAARRSRDGAAARRMLALALVLEGKSRTEAAQAAGMDRQTLRDWVHRYNEEGLAGLSDRHAAGTRRLLSPDQEAEGAEWVRQGPDWPSMAGFDGAARTWPFQKAGWSLSDRLILLYSIMSIPRRLGIAIGIGVQWRGTNWQEEVPEIKRFGLSNEQQDHLMAFKMCVSKADEWIRRNAGVTCPRRSGPPDVRVRRHWVGVGNGTQASQARGDCCQAAAG